ncbi:MAG TPA: outer membrane beta-barrel protein [Verrucomicrobiae bacterium]|nr:outer membrane beta-barrel protein [Verrucomicrobiae bacterium]
MKKRCVAGVVTLSLCFGAAVAQAQYYHYPPPPAGAYPPPPAGAYPPPPAGPYFPPDAGPYFRMDIGPSFFQDGELTQFSTPGIPPSGPVPSPVKYRTGLSADGAFGYAFNKYIAADFEVGYVGAQIDSVPGYFANNSYIDNIPFLANIRLSYPIPRSFAVLYAGVGVGGADVIFDGDYFGNNTDTVVGRENDVVFAWQAFAGLRFRLARDLSLGVGYKYFATADPTFTYPPDNFKVGFDGVRTHSVMATLEWKFW